MLKGPHFCARLKSMWQEQNFAPYNREEGAKFSRVITAILLFCNYKAVKKWWTIESKRKVFIFEKSAAKLMTKRNFTTWKTSFIEWKVLQNFSRLSIKIGFGAKIQMVKLLNAILKKLNFRAKNGAVKTLPLI